MPSIFGRTKPVALIVATVVSEEIQAFNEAGVPVLVNWDVIAREILVVPLMMISGLTVIVLMDVVAGEQTPLVTTALYWVVAVRFPVL